MALPDVLVASKQNKSWFSPTPSSRDITMTGCNKVQRFFKLRRSTGPYSLKKKSLPMLLLEFI